MRLIDVDHARKLRGQRGSHFDSRPGALPQKPGDVVGGKIVVRRDPRLDRVPYRRQIEKAVRLAIARRKLDRLRHRLPATRDGHVA